MIRLNSQTHKPHSININIKFVSKKVLHYLSPKQKILALIKVALKSPSLMFKIPNLIKKKVLSGSTLQKFFLNTQLCIEEEEGLIRFLTTVNYFMQQLLYKSTRKSSSYYHTTSFLLAITSHSIPPQWPGLAFFYCYFLFQFSFLFLCYRKFMLLVPTGK